MITAIQNNDEYIIRFQYDTEIINLVKGVPGRKFDAEHKYWTIPVARLGFLLAQFKGTPYENQLNVYSNENIGENDTLDPTQLSGIPDIDLSKVPLYVQNGYSLFSHQMDFMKYAIGRQRVGLKSGFILADEPGCGKTLQVMNLAMYNKKFNKIKHCLIIACVNSAKYNWIYDIEKHTNGAEIPYLLGARKRRDGTIKYDTGSSDAKLEDLISGHMYGKKTEPKLPFFLIMNIEALRMKRDRHFVMREQLEKLINSGYIGMIALDEAHLNISPSSKQGTQLLMLKKKVTRQIEWIPMTGTPIVNRATDVFTPLKLVDGHTYPNYHTWCQHFCVYGGFGNHNIIAYKNIPELKSMLQANMLRRLKGEVLDLPPKMHITEYIENTEYQTKLYNQVVAEVESQRLDILSSLNPMVKLLKLRQVNGSPELVDDSLTVDTKYLAKNAKLIRLLDLVDTIVDSGEKVVIFSNWVESLRTIYRFLARKYEICCYTGTMKDSVREQHKQRFINDPNVKIIMGTVGALGTSHTLTVARNVIFYDQPWNPSAVEQCEDRCHRAGTQGNVTIYTLITRGTVDERVNNLIMSKDGVAKYIVDNQLQLKDNPELFDLLLGQDNK